MIGCNDCESAERLLRRLRRSLLKMPRRWGPGAPNGPSPEVQREVGRIDRLLKKRADILRRSTAGWLLKHKAAHVPDSVRRALRVAAQAFSVLVAREPVAAPSQNRRRRPTK